MEAVFFTQQTHHIHVQADQLVIFVEERVRWSHAVNRHIDHRMLTHPVFLLRKKTGRSIVITQRQAGDPTLVDLVFYRMGNGSQDRADAIFHPSIRPAGKPVKLFTHRFFPAVDQS